MILQGTIQVTIKWTCGVVWGVSSLKACTASRLRLFLSRWART